MNAQVITLISSLISLLGICYLFFWGYRTFEVAWFRQDLFCLRDELFDYADSGKLSFDHNAYGALRSCINGYIRYGDRLTLWHTVSMKLFMIGFDESRFVAFEEAWAKAQKSLDSDVKEDLAVFKNRMENIAIRHTLLSAPEATLLIVPPLFIFFVATTLLESNPLHPVSRLRKNVTDLDNTAYLFGDELAAA